MSSEKMTALTMSGPLAQLDDVIRRFVIDRELHPEDAVAYLANLRKLKRVEVIDPYAGYAAQATGLLKKLGIDPVYVPFEDTTLEQAQQLLEKISGELSALDEEEKALQYDLTQEQTDPVLHCLVNVPESLKDLAGIRYFHTRVGRLLAPKWPEFRDQTMERDDEFAVDILEEDGYVYLLALALPDGVDRMDANLARLAFERYGPAIMDCPDCTAAELLAQAAAELDAGNERLAAIREERAQKTEAYAQELLCCHAWLTYRSACAQCRSYAGQRAGKFYLAGWVPADKAESFVAEFEAQSGFSCVAARASEVKHAKPPIRMKDKGIRSIMTPLVKMYGLPAYGTADPRVFMVCTYILFFGMMFGDAGQGACLALLGFLLYRKSKNWLWRVIGCCGCSAVVFGLIYGSVFGLEELLPWGGYHPLESAHIMPVLLAGAAVGVVVLLVCMGFNVVNALRAGDLKTALFSPNGLAGAVLYAAVIAAVVCAYTKAANLLAAWYILPFMVLPVLLIWFGDPLAKLLQGEKNWQPESWGMYIVEGFFDIFEAAISYMSNTMSFLRLGAFAISHAGMMMVVSMLSEGAAATGSVVIMIFGNIFVAGLEAALSSIQIIRLEFYEIFGRFYVSGGRTFSPVTVDYTK